MNQVVIGLGSNIDPDNNIEKAIVQFKTHFNLIKQTEFVRTKPIGYADQDDFVNGSVLIETELNQADLKLKLKCLEKDLGREVSSIKFGPRTIDLDIVVFNGELVDDDFYSRDFLYHATLELWPDLNYKKEKVTCLDG